MGPRIGLFSPHTTGGNAVTYDPNNPFAGMDDLDTAPVRATAQAEQVSQPCIKCGGSGQIRYGYVRTVYYPCGLCKGTGKVTAQRIKRVEAAKKAEVTRVQNIEGRRRLFAETEPEALRWIREKDGKFDFATAMSNALADYGCLTPNQLAAVKRCMARDAERRVERIAQAQANSVDVDAGAILACLNKAASTGLKRPKLLTEALTFALANANSRNPGCVYVTTPDDLYLGKITPAGKFQPSRDCSAEAKAQVVAIAGDVLAAAVLYGKQTGRCSCCGRELTDPVSVANGIGPICASKFF